jgi:hypothetical protein
VFCLPLLSSRALCGMCATFDEHQQHRLPTSMRLVAFPAVALSFPRVRFMALCALRT